jgi:hypothetical protein
MMRSKKTSLPAQRKRRARSNILIEDGTGKIKSTVHPGNTTTQEDTSFDEGHFMYPVPQSGLWY